MPGLPLLPTWSVHAQRISVSIHADMLVSVTFRCSATPMALGDRASYRAAARRGETGLSTHTCTRAQNARRKDLCTCSDPYACAPAVFASHRTSPDSDATGTQCHVSTPHLPCRVKGRQSKQTREEQLCCACLHFYCWCPSLGYPRLARRGGGAAQPRKCNKKEDKIWRIDSQSVSFSFCEHYGGVERGSFHGRLLVR